MLPLQWQNNSIIQQISRIIKRAGIITRCLIRDDEGLATLATGGNHRHRKRSLCHQRRNAYLCRLTLAWEPHIKSQECQHGPDRSQDTESADVIPQTTASLPVCSATTVAFVCDTMCARCPRLRFISNLRQTSSFQWKANYSTHLCN